MNKVYPDAASTLFDFRDGASVLVAGFGLCGNPENLIAAVAAGFAFHRLVEKPLLNLGKMRLTVRPLLRLRLKGVTLRG